jgi:hypothetical protein
MSAALMPFPRQQFFDANGKPLAGGQIFTYQAGTTTPLATYTDSTGTTANPNPVILDAGGFASIWLGGSNYKIVAEDANGVTQWSADNVSSVSLAQLQGQSTLAALTVSGNATVGGNETVNGTLTAAAANITGSISAGGTLTAPSAAISGALSAASSSISGNESVQGNESIAGTLNVTGAATFSSVNIGSQTLAQFINATVPALTALAGTLVVSSVAVSGGWVIFTFGSTTGTRVRIAFGAGTIATGSAITPPSGFSTANMLAIASMNAVNSTSGNNLDGLSVSVTGGTVTATGSDNSGHTFNGTANWLAVAWQQSY